MTAGPSGRPTGPFDDQDYSSRELTSFDFLALDSDTLTNPYPFFRALREREPVFREPRYGVYLVTRYEDIVSVARRPEVFSSVVAATGPLTPLPERSEGGSVDDQIERHRENLGRKSLLTLDLPDHQRYRLLVNKLFSPRRLKDVEDYVRTLSHALIDEFIDRRRVEFIDGFAGPLPFLVIADLLGVPREDHEEFKRRLRGEQFRIGNPNAPQLTHRREQNKADAGGVSSDLMEYLYGYFRKYIADRRENPRGDIMSQLATSTFPHSTEVPSVEDIVGLAHILFGAGQETTVRLFTTGMQILLARPDVMEAVCQDHSLIPNFIEETLRYDTPVKGLFRVAREDAEIGDVTVPAGSIIMLLWGAGNRDPEQFPTPESFDLYRREANRTLSFGHGIHFCVGAPLARMEARIGWEAFLSRVTNLRRAPDDGEYAYLPSFIIRGLNHLHLEFDPLPG